MTMKNLPNKKDWELAARSLLKGAMANHGIDYAELSRRMQAMEIENANTHNLRTKINRGSFSGAFLLQALIAIGVEELNIKKLPISKQFY